MALAPFPNRFGRPLLPISELAAAIGFSNNSTINAAGESHGLIGYLWLTSGPGTSKTLSAAGGGRILWPSGTAQTFANAATNLRVGINDVGAGGLEDGTHDVFKDLVGGTDPIAASSIIDSVMGSGSKSMTHGSRYAFVVEMTARGGVDSVTVGRYGTTVLCNSTYITTDTGAGPVKTNSEVSGCTIVFDDGTLGWFGWDTYAWSMAPSTAFQVGSTPDEYCQLVSHPWDFDASGMLVRLNAVAAADDFEAILYRDATGTPVVMDTITVDVSEQFGTNTGDAPVWLPFSSLQTIERNVTYGLAIRPTTANTIQVMLLNVGGAAYRALLPLGTNVALGTRTDQTGAFSADTSVVPVMGLIPAQLYDSDGAGGGGAQLVNGGLVAA